MSDSTFGKIPYAVYHVISFSQKHPLLSLKITSSHTLSFLQNRIINQEDAEKLLFSAIFKMIVTYNFPFARNGQAMQFPCMITLPTDFDPARESLPMIVFLHGAGERCDDTRNVAVNGIPRYFKENQDYHGLRVITLSPVCPDKWVWSYLVPEVMACILDVAAKYNVNRKRISITGLSMGGFGSWEMVTMYPDFFCAFAPICGGGMEWRVEDNIRDLPVRIFHGLDDTTVYPEHSVRMARALYRVGNENVQLTLWDKYNHNCWERAYEETDLIEWLANTSRFE